MKMIIDADACPREVLAGSMKLAEQHGIDIVTVANFNHAVSSPHHIVVGDSSQEADIKIANLTQPGDIVITQDWGLAALAIGKGAVCLSPSGREYKAGTLDFMLEERELKAKLRRSGGRTKGPKKRQARDDAAFIERLRQIILRKTGDGNQPEEENNVFNHLI